ncbi:MULTISPECIES: hypothetical protein [Xanthomonas]|uniref:hypothetical protein n=1 Tax=Xanthomonas TaxID=338 RepID=UPI000E1F4551|nr:MULTISPECIES: hypothetical protein [Xanthomonas]
MHNASTSAYAHLPRATTDARYHGIKLCGASQLQAVFVDALRVLRECLESAALLQLRNGIGRINASALMR